MLVAGVAPTPRQGTMMKRLLTLLGLAGILLLWQIGTAAAGASLASAPDVEALS